MKNKAFTLIELLVVVLIIGILTAIAVPQYQYAVLKSKYHTLMNMAKAVKDAQEVYFLANGKYAESFDELDISIVADEYQENYELINANGQVAAGNFSAISFSNKQNLIVMGSNEQIFSFLLKNGERSMDYNLRLNNQNMWGGARAICVAWVNLEPLGKKLCDDLTNAPESCALNGNRYSCRIY